MGDSRGGGSYLQFLEYGDNVMSRRIPQVIYISGNRATLYRAPAGQCQLVERFESTPAGLSRLAERIRTQPNAPTRVLVDLLEEELNLGTVPHTPSWSPDRGSVLVRHGERIFRNTPFRYTIVVGRSEQGRRDDTVLCAAITQPDALNVWVTPFLQAKVALEGIHSVPLQCQDLAQGLDRGRGRCLLVTQLGEHLRLSYFEDSRLKLSRLTPLRRASAAEVALSIIKEVEKTQLYLGRLRLTGQRQGEALRVWIVGSGALLQALRDKVPGKGGLDFQIVEINDFAKLLRIDGRWNTADCEELLVQLAVQRPPLNHYAGAELLRYAKWYRANTSMQTASVALLCVAVLGGGWNVSAGLDLEKDRAVLERETQLSVRQYTELEQTLPATPIPPDDIRSTVETAQRLALLANSPRPFLQPLGRTLQDFGDLRVDSIRWRTVTPEIAQAEIDPTAPIDGPDAVVWIDDEGKFLVREVAQIAGRVELAGEDLPRAVRRLEQFVAALSTTGAYTQVRLLKAPLATRPGETLEGIGGIRVEHVPSEFAVEVVMEHRHGP